MMEQGFVKDLAAYGSAPQTGLEGASEEENGGSIFNLKFEIPVCPTPAYRQAGSVGTGAGRP
jgi:hypothetical protein